MSVNVILGKTIFNIFLKLRWPSGMERPPREL